jgi:phosphatidylglycerol:prolipoprotein diacylglycerol transferase
MRQTLFRIALHDPWTFWTTDPVTGLPLVGVGFVWCLLSGLWLISLLAQTRWRWQREHTLTAAVAAGVALLLAIPGVASLLPVRTLPLWGYGGMLLLGFVAALIVGRRHARQAGFEPDIVFDVGLWMLISGIVGGRLAYLFQYGSRVFTDQSGHALRGMDLLVAAVNLSEGGLVLIGAMAGGAVGFFAFCRKNGIPSLALADVVTPSIFIGIGFGRLGCLLNGCCYGDPCSLPWGISFPAGSVTFKSLVEHGFLDPTAAATMPLHPTQIYSSIDGFLLAIVTALFFRSRGKQGEVFSLGCILCAITRFLIEFLRNDEGGQLGTGLTISQLYSIGILAAGLGVLAYVARRGQTALPLNAATERPLGAVS